MSPLLFRMEIPIERSKKAKRISMRVHPVRGVWVVAPLSAPVFCVEHFLSTHRMWGRKALARLRVVSKPVPIPKNNGVSFEARGRAALRSRAQYFAKKIGVTFSRFTLTNARSRWGSCSNHGDIAVQKKVFFLPPELQDYVLVHELCHRKHMHHGPAFWALVASILPDYKKLQNELKKYIL